MRAAGFTTLTRCASFSMEIMPCWVSFVAASCCLSLLLSLHSCATLSFALPFGVLVLKNIRDVDTRKNSGPHFYLDSRGASNVASEYRRFSVVSVQLHQPSSHAPRHSKNHSIVNVSTPMRCTTCLFLSHTCGCRKRRSHTGITLRFRSARWFVIGCPALSYKPGLSWKEIY